MEWLRNNWFVLFIYGLFLFFLGGWLWVQYKHWKRGDFKRKLNDWKTGKRNYW